MSAIHALLQRHAFESGDSLQPGALTADRLKASSPA
jgi:hypothetical protein